MDGDKRQSFFRRSAILNNRRGREKWASHRYCLFVCLFACVITHHQLAPAIVLALHVSAAAPKLIGPTPGSKVIKEAWVYYRHDSDSPNPNGKERSAAEDEEQNEPFCTAAFTTTANVHGAITPKVLVAAVTICGTFSHRFFRFPRVSRRGARSGCRGDARTFPC